MLSNAHNTYGADVSEFQTNVTNDYAEPFIIARANDGTYRDHHFIINLGLIMVMIRNGRLAFWGAYLVFELNWRDTLDAYWSQVGPAKHRPHQFHVIDLETWRGKITGDHSAEVNALREAIIARINRLRPRGTRKLMLRRDRRRVLIYANIYDLAQLAPNTGDARFIIANYDRDPHHSREVLRQMSDRVPCPPFGTCDMNVAAGRNVRQLARDLGVTTSPAWRRRHPVIGRRSAGQAG